MTIKAITGIAFAATLLASPAFAQAFQGNTWDAYRPFSQQDAYRPFSQQYDAYHSYAQEYPRARRHSPRRSWDAYNTQGRYVGSDPDPNVRQMIQRDPENEGQGW
jgi:hypothetical protein